MVYHHPVGVEGLAWPSWPCALPSLLQPQSALLSPSRPTPSFPSAESPSASPPRHPAHLPLPRPRSGVWVPAPLLTVPFPACRDCFPLGEGLLISKCIQHLTPVFRVERPYGLNRAPSDQNPSLSPNLVSLSPLLPHHHQQPCPGLSLQLTQQSRALSITSPPCLDTTAMVPLGTASQGRASQHGM